MCHPLSTALSVVRRQITRARCRSILTDRPGSPSGSTADAAVSRSAADEGTWWLGYYTTVRRRAFAGSGVPTLVPIEAHNGRHAGRNRTPFVLK